MLIIGNLERPLTEFGHLQTIQYNNIYMDLRGGGKEIQDNLNDPLIIKMLTEVDGLKRDLIWDENDAFSYFDGEKILKQI